MFFGILQTVRYNRLASTKLQMLHKAHTYICTVWHRHCERLWHTPKIGRLDDFLHQGIVLVICCVRHMLAMIILSGILLLYSRPTPFMFPRELVLPSIILQCWETIAATMARGVRILYALGLSGATCMAFIYNCTWDPRTSAAFGRPARCG
jgi:hypothetical protein